MHLDIIDFRNLEKMWTKSSEGLEVITVWKEMWPQALDHLQNCIIDPHIPVDS